jgi:DNA-binding MarR family transcriptional regulator
MRDDTTPAEATRDRLHLERFVPYRLSVLTNIVSMSIADAYEREFGLSIPQWRVIAVLARYPDLSAIEVAERTAMDKVAVSRAVQALLTSKRLVRSYDRGDRRRSVLRLSSGGRAVYTRVAPLALEYERRLLDALSPSDRRALDRLLGRLIDRAKTLDHRDPAPAVKTASRPRSAPVRPVRMASL